MNIPTYLQMLIPSDYSAVGHYRMLFPQMCLRTVCRDVKFIESSGYLGDPGVLKAIRSVRIQRPYLPSSYDFFFNVLKPASKAYGFWINVDVDDCLYHDDIPDYNIAKPSFAGDVWKRISDVMMECDFVSTTTKELANYYHDKLSIPMERFLIIPNYLPRWWIGGSFNWHESIFSFKKALRTKLKVGFICGGNHYDLRNTNGGVDDFTHLIDWIKSSLDVYDFHFVGGVPQQLTEELKSGKISIDVGCDILNYPRTLKERDYNLWICPLQDNIFNRCKSNIKLLEAWSLGIPVLVQDCKCYENYTPNRFKTADDLENLISALRQDEKHLADQIRIGRSIIDYGDQNAPNGWWLEKNLEMHRQLATMPQRTLEIDLSVRLKKEEANYGNL